MTDTKQLERERIIFFQGIKESNAIDLSLGYSNLVIFSKGEKFKNVWINNDGRFIPNSPYETNDYKKYDDKNTILGCNIIKGGNAYTLVKGIHPKRNYVSIDERKLNLYLDGNGLINLVYGNYEIIFKDGEQIKETRYKEPNSTLGKLPDPKKEYTITWNPNNGGTNYIAKVTWTWENNNNYWSPSTSGDNPINSSTKVTNDLTYYAIWGFCTDGNYKIISKAPSISKSYYNFQVGNILVVLLKIHI